MEPIMAPNEFVPKLYPPFPDGTQPCIELETISLCRLRDDEAGEREKLFSTCCTKGFFYLDFSDTGHSSLPHVAEDIGHLAERVFKLSPQEKQNTLHEKPYSLLG